MQAKRVFVVGCVFGAVMNLSWEVQARNKASIEDAEAVLERGKVLYEKHCAACHGESGLGDGKAAYLLSPKPRDFRSGHFRITSTEFGFPSDDDIMQTLTLGMAGSAMPSWGHFPKSDLKALIAVIKHLTLEGKIAELIADDDSMTRSEASEIAEDIFKPGPIIKIPTETGTSSADIALGRKVYDANCAKCHDADGRGLLKRDMKTEEGLPIFARDFTQGIFKGGGEGIDLARRIVRGMPGTPMPAFDYTGKDLWALVHYIQTMIKPGAQEKVRQKQTALAAKRIGKGLEVDPNSSVWHEAASVSLPIMPLWWRNDRIEEVGFQAVHDGSRLAIRLSWKDPVRNDTVLGQHSFTDGAAIQFSAEDDPPFFAMGSKDSDVNIWHWKAIWERDIEDGTPALKEAFPNITHNDTDYGVPQDVSYDTGEGAGNPLSHRTHASAVEDLNAEGFGTLTSQRGKSQNIDGKARWKDGEWSVVFARKLKGNSRMDTRFVPGKAVSIALAIWDGEAQDRNGQKSVTIWHSLTLEK